MKILLNILKANYHNFCSINYVYVLYTKIQS
nr:MAG TPA: hypothetical protein [Crassvirales sp.]